MKNSAKSTVDNYKSTYGNSYQSFLEYNGIANDAELKSLLIKNSKLTLATEDYIKENLTENEMKDYYENNFTNEDKTKIKSKDLCMGKYYLDDAFSEEKECSITKSGEKVGLLVPTDYHKASLSDKCTTLSSLECTNYNYLADSEYIDTWLLNTYEDNTYEVLYLNGVFDVSSASNSKKINPVIYLINNVKVINGKGTEEEPFVIK